MVIVSRQRLEKRLRACLDKLWIYIKKVKSPKTLGFTIYENLTSKKHAEVIIKK